MENRPEYIDPKYLTPHYSAKIWRGYKSYLTTFFSESLFTDICNEMQVPESFATQDGNWLSNKFATDFIEILKMKVGDKDIAEKVGAFTVDPRCINDYEYAVLKSIPMIASLFILPLQTRKLNQFHDFKVKFILPGKFRLEIKPKFKESTCEDVFLNSQGLFSAVAKLNNVNNLKVKIERSEQRVDHVIFDLQYSVGAFSILKFAFGLFLFLFGMYLPQLLFQIEIIKSNFIFLNIVFLNNFFFRIFGTSNYLRSFLHSSCC